MHIFDNIRRFISRLTRRPESGTPISSRGGISAAPREAVNDALAYGVEIKAATVAPGGWYWQAVRVHHLTPEENGGNHHVYLDLLDPALGDGSNPNGGRVFGARARITWDGGEQVITVDKPLNEPGANFPMWKWQVCAATALGLSGEEWPSDKVTGMHTGHPDEAPGNTLFHHSFSVTFVKVQAPDVVYTDSVLYGAIHHAAGRTAELLQNNAVVASQLIGADETFRFADLGAGEYTIGVAGTQFRSAVVRVTGRDQVQLDLTLILAESAITGRVRNGAGRAIDLVREDISIATQTIAEDETYRFAGLTVGEYKVVLPGAGVASPLVTLDGVNSVTVDLVAPTPGKSLAHYVLFGPAGAPATQAHLLLAQDYLLTFQPAFGFSPAEAAGAGMVTIIADFVAVSAELEAGLHADGTPVQRIAGTVEEVAAALTARIMERQAF